MLSIIGLVKMRWQINEECDCDWGKDDGQRMEGGESLYRPRRDGSTGDSQHCTLYKHEYRYLEKSCDTRVKGIGFR